MAWVGAAFAAVVIGISLYLVRLTRMRAAITRDRARLQGGR